MTADLTRPETAAEWPNVGRIRAQIYRCGGCAMCSNRAGSAWGRGYCKVESRTFPLCMKTPGLEFSLDESTIQRAA